MARNYVSELTAVRNAINDCIKNGGLVSLHIADQTYTVGMGALRVRETKLENLIRIRNGGGRSIIGEVTL